MIAIAPTRTSRKRIVCKRKLEPNGLAEIASQRLRESGHPTLGQIECSYDHGVARLTGRVSSYHMKQVAQSILLSIQGVELVHNQLEVAAKHE